MRDTGRSSSLLLLFIAAATTYVVSQPYYDVGAPATFTFISRNTELTQINGILQQNDTATVRCPAGRWSYTTTPNLNGTVDRVEFECQKVLRYLSRTFIWSIPRDVVLTKSEQCLTQNPYQFSPNSTTRSTEGFVTTEPPVAYNASTDSMLVGGWGDSLSIFTNIACAYANSVGYGIPGAFGGPCSPNGGNGITAEEFSAFGTSVANQFDRVNNLIGGLQRWQGAANTQFDFIINAFQATQAFQQATIWTSGNLTRAVASTQAQINSIRDESTTAIRAIQNQLVATNTNALNLTQTVYAFVQANQNELNNLFLQQTQQYAILVTQVNNISAAVNSLTSIGQTRDLTTQNAINTLSGSIQAVITQSQYLQGLTSQWRLQRAEIAKLNLGTGRNYRPFVDFVGAPGVADLNNLPSNLKQKDVEVPSVRYIMRRPANAPSKALAVTSSLAYKCSGPWMALNQMPQSTWTDFFNTLVPLNCSTPTVNISTTPCDCWMEVVENYCEMASDPTTGAINATSLSRWIQYGDPGFPAPGASLDFCVPNSLNKLDPDGFPGLVKNTIRSFDDFMLYQRTLCERGINPFSGVPQGYTIFSPAFAQQQFVPYVASACTAGISELMNPPVGSYSLVYVLVQAFFIQALSLSTTASQQLSSAIYGSPPTNATFVTTEYVQSSAGIPIGTCKTMYVVAYDTSEFVALYRYDAVRTANDVSVFVNGKLYDTITDGIVYNEYSQFALPSGSYVWGVIGKQWVSSVYDMAYSQTVPNYNPLARAGRPDYGAFPTLVPLSAATASNHNLTAWTRFNIAQFDHFAGSASIDKFRNQLICDNSFSPPSCVCNITSPGVANNGVICQMLTYFQILEISPVENPNPGKPPATYVMTSQYDQTVATIRIPQGPLIANAASICPIVNFIVSGNYFQQAMSITNPAVTNNIIQVVETSACGIRSQRLNMSPRDVIQYLVEYCPTQPETVPIQLQFNFFNNASGILGFYPCGPAYNITINPTNPAAAVGLQASSWVEVKALQSVTTDNTLLAVQRLQAQMVAIVQASIYAMIDTMSLSNLPVSTNATSPLGAFDSILSRLNQIALDTSRSLAETRNLTLNPIYSNQTVNYAVENQKTLDDARFANDLAYNATKKLAESIQSQQINLAVLINITNENERFLNESRDAIIAMRSLVDQITDSMRNRGYQGSIFDLFSSVGDFLVGIGEMGIDGVNSAVDVLKDLSGTFADTMGGMFGALGSLGGSIVIIVVVIIVIVVVVMIAIKCGGCKGLQSTETANELKELNMRLERLEAILRVGSPPSHSTTAKTVASAPSLPSPSSSSADAAAAPSPSTGPASSGKHSSSSRKSRHSRTGLAAELQSIRYAGLNTSDY